MRQQRKADLEKHVEEINRLVKQANPDISSSGEEEDSEADDSNDNGEWNGIKDDAPAEAEAVIDQEDEYIDEDKYTTVTIESVGISKSGFEKAAGAKQDDDDDAAAAEKQKREWTKEKPKSDRPKKPKKKKFRYETKAERKMERVKQGLKKKKQAQARKGK